MEAEKITRRALVAALVALPIQPAAARGRGGGSRGARKRSGARSNAFAFLGFLFFGGALAWFLYLAIAGERKRQRRGSNPPAPSGLRRPRSNTKAIRKAIARHEGRMRGDLNN